MADTLPEDAPSAEDVKAAGRFVTACIDQCGPSDGDPSSDEWVRAVAAASWRIRAARLWRTHPQAASFAGVEKGGCP